MTPRCGICKGLISNTMVPHGAICEDDVKADSISYSPEIDDLIKLKEEFYGNEI